MAETKAFATLSVIDTDTSNSYRIRLNALVSRSMFNGVEFVRLNMTGDYIIVTPLTESWRADGDKAAIRVFRKDNAVWVSVNKLVNKEGIMGKDLFGHRYKVKRDKKGRIYICLNEVVA